MSKFLDRVSAVLVFSYLVGLIAPQAAAQSGASAGESVSGSRNTSVRERSKPELEPTGVRMGGFMLYPTVTLSEEYTSNVFAEPVNERDDFVTHLGAGLSLRSNWNNHALGFSANAEQRWFAEFDEQNAFDGTVGADGRIDVSRDTQIGFGASYGSLYESIAYTPSNALVAEPISYTQESANVYASQRFNRFRIGLEGRTVSYNYDDGVLLGGGPLEQDDRDVEITEAVARADLAIGGSTALFVAVRGNWRKNDVSVPVNRDSDGREVIAGVAFDLANLARGEIGVGALKQEYEQPGASDVDGAAARARIEWFPDDLVTVTFNAQRDIGDAGYQGATGYVSDTLSVQADYEFRRSLVFGLGVWGAQDSYRGIDREDTRRRYDASADYIVNRTASAFLQFSSYSQQSDGAQRGREFDAHRVWVGLRLRR